MAKPEDFEPGIFATVSRILTKWLSSVRQAVFGRGRDFPDPSAVQNTAGEWADLVQAELMPELQKVAEAGWESLNGEGYISANGFVLAQLALTENLLVRIPDEVYNMVFVELVEGQQAGLSPEQIGDRIDSLLFFAGQERWTNRGKVIAVTETHRAWQAGLIAAAQYYEPSTGRGWTKTWVSENDESVRPCHRAADGQTVGLRDTYTVCGEQLMYPGDPSGNAANVIACRCDQHITES